MTSRSAAESMAAYYARRAQEYERVYAKPERQAELRALEAWLPGVLEGRRVLEVACGTGWWTRHGAARCASWLATDINSEPIAIAQAEALPRVEYRRIDAYALHALAPAVFDAAFAAFWWSHVPRAQLAGWLEHLHDRLEPGATVVMLDNRYVEGSSTPLTRCDPGGDTFQQRRLDDGSIHDVLKNFPTRDESLAALGPRARDTQWIEHRHYWALKYVVA